MKWQENLISDLRGRVALVTGANSGLGKLAARALAAKGAQVIMACRSLNRAEDARREIAADLPSARLQVVQLDTADLSSVRACAEWMLRHFDRIDLQINNAGVMAIPYQRSADGHEMQWAANYLGHFALTGLILPALLATPGSRVVNVSSIAARSGKLDYDRIAGQIGYDAWAAYNQSKLANLTFSLELQRRLSLHKAATVATCAHPGASLTNLFSTPGSFFAKRILSPLMRPFFQPAEQGVLPILFAATSPDATPGGYYGPSRWNEMKGPTAPAHIPRQALDADAGMRLWQLSEQQTQISYL